MWSLESLRRWLKEAGDDRPETVQKYVGYLPEHLVRRFIAKEGDAVLVTGRLPDVDSSRILPVVEKIDRALDDVRKQHPDFRISVTGLPAIAARNSARMISPAQRGAAAVRCLRRGAAGDCVPLGVRRAGEPAAGALSGCGIGCDPVGDGRRAGVCLRGGAAGGVRAGHRCADPLLQPAQPGGAQRAAGRYRHPQCARAGRALPSS